MPQAWSVRQTLTATPSRSTTVRRINESGLWQTTENDSGTYQILVQVSDGNLSDTQYVEVQVFNSTTMLQNNFTDGSAKSFKFTGGENQSAVIRLPKNITVLYAALRLEGSG